MLFAAVTTITTAANRERRLAARHTPSWTPMDVDARLERLAELLETALQLATEADAPARLEEVAKLCREAAEVATAP